MNWYFLGVVSRASSTRMGADARKGAGSEGNGTTHDIISWKLFNVPSTSSRDET